MSIILDGNRILSKGRDITDLITKNYQPSFLRKDVSADANAIAGGLFEPSRISEIMSEIFFDELKILNTIPMFPPANAPRGEAAQWKRITSRTVSGIPGKGFLDEGNLAAAMKLTTTTASSPYTTMGKERRTTEELRNAARGGTIDEFAIAAMYLMRELQFDLQHAVLGGSRDQPLGQVTGLSATATGSSSLPDDTYYFRVVALNYQGWVSATYDSDNPQVYQSATISPIIGESSTVYGGSGQVSDQVNATTVAGQQVDLAWTHIKGAVAYAVYAGVVADDSDLYLQDIVYNNSFTLSTLVATGQIVNTLNLVTDYSAYSNEFNGIFSHIKKSGSRSYYKDMAGAALTATADNGITQIEEAIDAFDAWDVKPAYIFVNKREASAIDALVVDSFTNNVTNAEDGGVTIKLWVKNYSNREANTAIPIISDNYVPPGTILFLQPNLPQWAANDSTIGTRAYGVRPREGYQDTEFDAVRSSTYGLYLEPAFPVYADFCFGAITNIGT